jgi:hypothetical protein
VGGAVMKTFVRKVGFFITALIFAVTLTAGTGLPRPAYNECERNTSWSIWNELDSHWTTTTKNGGTTTSGDWSSRSEQHSSRGEDWNKVNTHHWNPDSSSHGHEESSYSDPEGKGCHNSDGIPRKWNSRRDEDTDSKGNRKEHIELIEEKNGKCEKWVRDREWDSKGNLIKDVKSTTEVPCGKWILEWSREGSTSEGSVSIQRGPNTAKIYLESTGAGTYKGNGEGVFDDKYSGLCTGWLTHPFSVDVTAKEVKFGGNDELDFSVKVTMRQVGSITCAGKSNDVGVPETPFTRTFSLPPEDGASWTDTFPMQGGQLTDTFTLKKR